MYLQIINVNNLQLKVLEKDQQLQQQFQEHNQMEYLNLLEGAHSTKFEDTLAEGDIFAIRINCSNNGNMSGLGAKFVWRI